jgi:hypothetical protein
LSLAEKIEVARRGRAGARQLRGAPTSWERHMRERTRPIPAENAIVSPVNSRL